MYIAAQRQQIFIFFDQQGLKATLKNMAAAAVEFIKPDRVSNYKMAHKLAQICPGGLNQQMKVIIHKNVADKVDTESFATIDQGINKSSAVSVSNKDILTMVASVHYMVIGTGVLYS